MYNYLYTLFGRFSMSTVFLVIILLNISHVNNDICEKVESEFISSSLPVQEEQDELICDEDITDLIIHIED